MSPRHTACTAFGFVALGAMMFSAAAFATGSEMAGPAEGVALLAIVCGLFVVMLIAAVVRFWIARRTGAIKRPWIRATLVLMALVPVAAMLFIWAKIALSGLGMTRYAAQRDAQADAIRGAQPGQLAALIERYENATQEFVLVETLGSGTAPLNAEDQAALDGLIERLRARQVETRMLDARLIWERDAAPGRMAQMLGACERSGPAGQVGCQLGLLGRTTAGSRLCVDGHYLPEDLSAVESLEARTSRDYVSQKDTMKRWLSTARTGCGPRQ